MNDTSNDVLHDARLDEDVTRWRQAYVDYSPAVPWRPETITRHTRQHRSARITRRVGGLAAAAAVVILGTAYLSNQPRPDYQRELTPAATPTYTFSTTGCASNPHTCGPVVAQWMAEHALTASETPSFLTPQERPRLAGANPFPYEQGYTTLEADLSDGNPTPGVKMTMLIQVSPRSTTSTYPGVEKGPLTGSKTVSLRDSTTARVWALTTGSSWQKAVIISVDSVTGVHPAIDVNIGLGNLNNSGIAPNLPPEVTDETVLDLVNRLL